jgi:hypothetical protein
LEHRNELTQLVALKATYSNHLAWEGRLAGRKPTPDALKIKKPVCRKLNRLFRFSSSSFRRPAIGQDSDKKNDKPSILNFKKKFGVLDKGELPNLFLNRFVPPNH